LTSNHTAAARPAADKASQTDTYPGAHRFRFAAQQIIHFANTLTADRGACLTAAIFFLFALPTCLLLAVIVPPAQVADEPSHLLRADSLLYGELFGQRRTVVFNGKSYLQAGLVGDPNLFFLGQPRLHPTAADLGKLEAVTWAPQPAWLWDPTTAVYPPIFCLPTTAAIGAAKLLGLSPFHALITARIVNVFCFLALALAALLLATRGRLLLLCALSLPMTLSLAASLNQDGLLIVTAALAFALLTRAVAPRGLAYWLAAALLAAVIAVKLPYLPLLLLLLMPSLGAGRAALAPALRIIGIAALPGIIWAAIVIHFVATPFPLLAPYHPGYLWPGDHQKATFDSPDFAEQAKVFIHRPLYPLVLPIESIKKNWEGDRETMIGRFGWLEYSLRHWMYTAWGYAILCAIAGDLFRRRSGTTAAPLAAAIGLFAIAATILAICDAEYLMWTQVGMPWIDGIQGRYFLPLVAALGIALPGIKSSQASFIKALLVTPTFAMLAIGMINLPLLMAATYYLR
jgi:uncharacterized membrane protein